MNLRDLRGVCACLVVQCGLFSFASARPVVHIVVDMDPVAPGIQHTVDVAPGTTVIPGVPIFIYAAEGQPSIRSIGYIGGIDRGIAFGHAITNSNRGRVASITPHAGTPVIPGSNTEFLTSIHGGLQHWFDGPEVQYLEFGAATTVIQPFPTPPIFTVDIVLTAPRIGDVFAFHLLDAVAANFGPGRGAFTTQNGSFIDTGGDATPDLTRTIAGLDPDDPAPVPPASFIVDLIDGPPSTGGPATIRVVCTADYTGDGQVTSQDFFEFLTRFLSLDPSADFNRDGLVDSRDFFDFIGAFFVGCA